MAKDKEFWFIRRVAPRGSSRIIPWSSTFQYLFKFLVLLTEPTEVCNFVDDNIFACGKDLNSLIKRMEHDSN